ncbi:MAG TPA: IS1634 family transposase, partial [Pseudonocardiaceae bacterium]|nr:IS1634 family transposase [Pseudonocardiaceae bacterium]
PTTRTNLERPTRAGRRDSCAHLLIDPRHDQQTHNEINRVPRERRRLAPSSKLAATRWIEHDVVIDGLECAVVDEACYRAMDWLITVEPALSRIVYDNSANLLNLEVDLLFFDTTSTYFEIEDADAPIGRDERGMPAEHDGVVVKETGFRTWGKSKDSRPDLPQIVIGMAVTRDGIPVRCWAWPGNTADSALIRQVKDDMRDWSLSRVVWVADRGFTSAENRRYLQRAGGHYILGEKLRGESPEARAALSWQGRYKTVAGNMEVKEVRLDADLADDRFVVCFNPDAALRDAAIRARMVTLLEETITGSDKLSRPERAKLEGVISTKPGLKRYLRVTPGGLLRVDKKKISAEENLDGKFLLRTSDPTLSAEDIALGYKQLLEVERGWRDMKQIIDLRPVYHRHEQRIRAHVLLCWLALLLIRIAETTTGQTWPTIREELQRLHLGTFTGPAGSFRQRTELTHAQKKILTTLGLPEPRRVHEATPSTP